MKRKCLAVGIILLFVGIACVPGISAKVSATPEKIETSDRDIYFFAHAFVKGEYENCGKWIAYYDIWNSNRSIHSINVLGYSSYQDKWIFVKAWSVHGNNRIGFIGRHHCCIFSFFDLTVE